MESPERTTPHRVMVSNLEAVPPHEAKEKWGVEPDVILTRKDGWKLGAPFPFIRLAYESWKDEWESITYTDGDITIPIELFLELMDKIKDYILPKAEVH